MVIVEQLELNETAHKQCLKQLEQARERLAEQSEDERKLNVKWETKLETQMSGRDHIERQFEQKFSSMIDEISALKKTNQRLEQKLAGCS